MRRWILAAALAVAALAAAGAGCGAQEEKPAAPTAAENIAVRQPKGRERIDVIAKVKGIRATVLPSVDGSKPATLTLFTLVPGKGAPLLTAAAPDLDLDSDVREQLLNRECEGKVTGDFQVAGAPAGRGFDWELVSAKVVAGSC